MRPIHKLIIHCSATRPDVNLTPAKLEAAHKARGFTECGYHFYIRHSGIIITMRDIAKVGAHCRGHNQDSIGICYEGGLDSDGNPADTRTFQQKYALRTLIRCLQSDYPGCQVYGHRDLSPDLDGDGIVEPEEWVKSCPCFFVTTEFGLPSLEQ
jgi:N-acetylmuramoyl-L-alanine amidase